MRDWTILGGLLTIAITLMVTRSSPMLRGMRAASLNLTGAVEARLSFAGHILRARQENRNLRRNNLELNSQLLLLREAGLQHDRLVQALGFKESQPYTSVAARIVHKNLDESYNFVTLNVGTDDSVRTDMPVVNEKGIIGRIVEVSPSFSRVMTLINTQFRVPARIDSVQATGIVRWPGTDQSELELQHVVRTADVKIGYQVVTSDESGIFPPGYLIGTVVSVRPQPSRPDLHITIRPAVSLQEAHYAFVLGAIMEEAYQAMGAQP